VKCCLGGDGKHYNNEVGTAVGGKDLAQEKHVVLRHTIGGVRSLNHGKNAVLDAQEGGDKGERWG